MLYKDELKIINFKFVADAPVFQICLKRL